MAHAGRADLLAAVARAAAAVALTREPRRDQTWALVPAPVLAKLRKTCL